MGVWDIISYFDSLGPPLHVKLKVQWDLICSSHNLTKKIYKGHKGKILNSGGVQVFSSQKTCSGDGRLGFKAFLQRPTSGQEVKSLPAKAETLGIQVCKIQGTGKRKTNVVVALHACLLRQVRGRCHFISAVLTLDY